MLVLIECEGRPYINEASGVELTMGFMRSYFEVTSSTFNASGTPLTEITTGVRKKYDRDPASFPAEISINLGHAFVLKDIG